MEGASVRNTSTVIHLQAQIEAIAETSKDRRYERERSNAIVLELRTVTDADGGGGEPTST